MDKFLYGRLAETDIPHIAVFLNDVQRKKTRQEGKFAVSATFLPGHFKGYTVRLNPLDGVYYCDIRPNMRTDPFPGVAHSGPSTTCSATICGCSLGRQGLLVLKLIARTSPRLNKGFAANQRASPPFDSLLALLPRPRCLAILRLDLQEHALRVRPGQRITPLSV